MACASREVYHRQGSPFGPSFPSSPKSLIALSMGNGAYGPPNTLKAP